jgi:hypothetical protein
VTRLYHENPWTDTAEGVCSSFELYRHDPIEFFMGRFAGMTMPVARFLATRVFCILGDSSDGSRVSVEEFGVWAEDLPAHFSIPGPARAISISSTQGHPLASGLPPSGPTSWQASADIIITGRDSRFASPSSSFAQGSVESELPTVPDNDNEGELHEEPREEEARPNSRTSLNRKRRKRGTQKNKGKDIQADLAFGTLAEASQGLAREISRSSKAFHSGHSIDPVPPTPTIAKKPSKWKLIIGKGNGERNPTVPAPTPAAEEFVTVDDRQISETASNVTNLILGLDLPRPSRSPRQHTSIQHGPMQSAQRFDDSAYTRGRRGNSPYGDNGGAESQSHIVKWADSVKKRDVSPTSTRSGTYLASSTSSVTSSNWRSSNSTAGSTGSSSSTFTRYSNSSASTVATSISSGSWRNADGSGHNNYRGGNLPPLPPNVKCT